MSHENIRYIDTNTSEAPPSSKKEKIFETIVENDIIQAFSNDLAEADFTPEQISQFEREIGKLDEESIKGVLSVPKELRARNFSKYYKLIEKGEKTISDIVNSLSLQAKTNGYTLGYHATNNEILPNGEEWKIDGTEFDDRDDRTMAYYSMDYKNIYRANRSKYLYIVRANIGKDTEHKRDTSNNWGRADTLAIVHMIDLVQTDEEVEKIYAEGQNNKQQKSAA